jgi:hypothetical protein
MPHTTHHGHWYAAVYHGRHADATAPAPPATPGPLGTIRALEDDVATYVARNDLREHIRGFVQEAVLALVARPEVRSIVVNAHSQGTVVCLDVLRRIPWQTDAPKLARLVTAGSPIRKYIDMFAWGNDVSRLGTLPSPWWSNFYDPRDPVADPLGPASWRAGDALPSGITDNDSLLVAIDRDTGEPHPVAVDDVPVDNIKDSSGGGLQAHDYWGNPEFVAQLAKLLR